MMARTHTVIEIAEHEARVILARTVRKALVIQQAARIPLDAGEEGDAAGRAARRGEQLRAGLKQAGIKSGAAIWTAPKSRITVRHAVLPSIHDAELAGMARFEAQRHIPFNAERHSFSHHILRKEGIAGTHVMLAAIDQPAVEEIMELSTAAGVEIDALDVATMGHFNVLAANAPASFHEETSAIVHLDGAAADITIVSNGLPVFTRSAPVGWIRLRDELAAILPERRPISIVELQKVDLLRPFEGLRALGFQALDAQAESPLGEAPTRVAGTDAASVLRQWLGRLGVEIQRSYSFAQREFNCPPITRLHLSGEAAPWLNFDAYLRGSLDVDTHILQPFDGLAAPSELDAETWRRQAAFAAAVGALARLWRTDAVAINLSPAAYEARRRSRRRMQSGMVSVGLCLLVAVLAFVLFQQSATIKENQIEELENWISLVQPNAEDLLDREAQLGIINRHRNDNRSALAILETMSSLDYIPSRVTLRSFKFTRGRYVDISGQALERRDLTRFITDLENAKYKGARIFEIVRQTQSPSKDLYGSQIVEFQLICQLESPGDA